MELRVIATGSKGNAYALVSESGEMLLLECGVPLRDVLRAVGWQLGSVVGVLLTHEHGDHAAYVRDYLRARLRVYTGAGTIEAVCERWSVKRYERSMLVACQSGVEVSALRAGFRVIPFGVEHDAREPMGFLVRHEECGTLLFATDTYFIRPRFGRLDNVLIECNYQDDVLSENVSEGLIPFALLKRLEESHMSEENCRLFLSGCRLEGCRNIVLIHMSSGNCDPERARKSVELETGVRTVVARAGLRVPLDATPF